MSKPNPKTNSQSKAAALQRPAQKLEIVSISAPELKSVEVELTPIKAEGEDESTQKQSQNKLKLQSKSELQLSGGSEGITQQSEKLKVKLLPKKSESADPVPQQPALAVKDKQKPEKKIQPPQDESEPQLKEHSEDMAKQSEKPKVKLLPKKSESADPVPQQPALAVKDKQKPEKKIQPPQDEEETPSADLIAKSITVADLVTEPIPEIKSVFFPCQAVGVVTGTYIPSSDETFNKGSILTSSGSTYSTHLLGKAIKPMQKKIDLSVPHHFIVYPKTTINDNIYFEVLAVDTESKIAEFGYNQFTIRGQISGQFEKEEFLLVQIHRNPDYLKPHQREIFTLRIAGTLPENFLKQYVSVKCELDETRLKMITFEHLACPLGFPKSKPISKKKLMNNEQAKSVEDLIQLEINPE